MHSISTIIISSLLLISSTLAGPVEIRNYNDMDGSFNIFKDANKRWQGAICKDQITTGRFPDLMTPPGFRGGCVRC